MPAGRVWNHRSVGARAMKITVVGAALIIAAAIVVVLVVRALNNKQDGASHA